MSDVVRGAISESIMSNSSSIINGDPPGTHGDRSKSKSMFVRIRNATLTVIVAQVLSLVLCGTAVLTQMLKNWFGFDASVSQVFPCYAILGLVFGSVLAVRKDFLSVLKNNWWKYLLLGIADVEGNYLVILSQKYTTLTSVQLLDSTSLFTVLLLSFLFLRVRYYLIHIIGVGVCLFGIICLIVADVNKPQEKYASNIPLGDVLCITGSILFGISNVSQEFLVKNHSIVEFLALLGISGCLISGLQLSLLERESVVSVDWDNYRVGLLLASFVAASVLFYILMPVVTRRTSATVVNLSLLTADFYALLFGIFLFKYSFSWLYFVAFCLIVVGLTVYNLKDTSKTKQHFLSLISTKLKHCNN